MIFMGIGNYGTKLQNELFNPLADPSSRCLMEFCGITENLQASHHATTRPVIIRNGCLSPWQSSSDFLENCNNMVETTRNLLENFGTPVSLIFQRDLGTELGGIFASGLLEVLSDEFKVDLIDFCALPLPGDKKHGPFDLMTAVISLQYSEIYATTIFCHESGHDLSFSDLGQAIRAATFPIYNDSAAIICMDPRQIHRSLLLSGYANKHASCFILPTERRIPTDSLLVIKRNCQDKIELPTDRLYCMEYSGTDKPNNSRRRAMSEQKSILCVTPNRNIQSNVLNLTNYVSNLCDWKQGSDSAYLYALQDRYGVSKDDLTLTLDALQQRHQLVQPTTT